MGRISKPNYEKSPLNIDMNDSSFDELDFEKELSTPSHKASLVLKSHIENLNPVVLEKAKIPLTYRGSCRVDGPADESPTNSGMQDEEVTQFSVSADSELDVIIPQIF